MPAIQSLCLTCLCINENGISMPSTIIDFVQNTLGFKFTSRENLPHNLVCLPCYRTLCDMKRFYVQLQEVEHYFNEAIVQSKKELTPRKTEGSNTGSTKATILENANVEIRINETDPVKVSHNLVEEINSHEEPTKLLLQEMVVDPETENICNISFADTPYKCDPVKVSHNLVEEINSHEEPTKLLLQEMVVDPETENICNISFADTPYKCDKCFRVFDVQESYKKHLQWHISHRTTSGKSEREKKIECEMCGKLFTTQTQKRTHEVTHTNLRPYKCSVCPKTFRQLSGLSVHRTVHFGKQVECPECCKRFSTKSEVLKHMNVHKQKWKAYQCNVCMQPFSKRDELREHRLTHNEQFKCDECNKMYCNKKTLQEHVSIAHSVHDNA